MKNKVLMGLIATATIGTSIVTPAMIKSPNTTKIVNKVLMVNNANSSLTNEAVVINGNSSMNLYGLSNGFGIVSNLSTGEMLTILGQVQNGYCKVKVQETGAVGYINVANMQNILNGTNDSFTQLSGIGQVVNVSSNVRLRSNPAIGNNIIGHLSNGTSLNILGKQGQWYKVSVNGQTGFIYEEYVSINVTSSNRKTLSTNSSNHVKNVVIRTKNSATSNIQSNNVNENNSNTIKNNSQSKSNKPEVLSNNTVKIINYPKSQTLYPNNIIVENTTGKSISDSELISVIKNWILVQQYNYSGFADCNGTMWSKQWLDNIPASNLIDYFIDVNGKSALSKNITTQELNKTAEKSLVYAQEHPNPFNQELIEKYITQMLKESYPNQIITKIVYHGSKKNGGLYYVYTKELGNKTPFWYVESGIGYATGV